MKASHMSTTEYLIENTLKLGDSFALDQLCQNKAELNKIIQNIAHLTNCMVATPYTYLYAKSWWLLANLSQ